MTFGVFNGPGRPWTLGRVAGIPIRLQPFLLVLVVGLALSQALKLGWQAGVMTVFGLGLVLGSVLLHELGHALVARRLGVGVLDITLWPLGGVAMLQGMPDDPSVEGAVALAGPLVNFLLAGLGAAGLLLMGVLGQVTAPSPFQLEVVQVLVLLVWVNLVMGLFNLLPAFPMDGGKILRSFLARRRGWLRGTETAAQVGRLFAWGMILFGWQWSLMMPFLGLFLLFAGSKELLGVRLRHAMGGAAGSPFGQGGFAFWNLEEVLRRATQGGGPFAGQGPSGGSFPGASNAGRQASQSGFSEEDVRRMEAERGRLRRDELP
jgi:Zn-dependent protease